MVHKSEHTILTTNGEGEHGAATARRKLEPDRGNTPKGENRMNNTIRFEEIVEQYSDGTEYSIYLVWNATVQGQWESFASYEEAICFIRKVTGDDQYCPY